MPTVNETVNKTMRLTCSANTLRSADLPTRVSAVASAGFEGLGLRVTDFTESGLELCEIRDLLERYGLRTLEVEHTWDWAAREVHPVEGAVFAYAQQVGLRQLNVPMFYPHHTSEVMQGFGRLCDRAVDHGVLVALEFLPYSYVKTLNQAWSIVGEADRANGAVVIDFWHMFRSHCPIEDLTAIPVEKIASLQLCDVRSSVGADLAEEARHHRLLPGRGVGPTAETLTTLQGMRFSGPSSVEVFSDDLDALPADRAAELAYEAGASVLEGAGLIPAPWHTNLHA